MHGKNHPPGRLLQRSSQKGPINRLNSRDIGSSHPRTKNL
ncbi:hypothetical protein JL2886_02104 [Phaeobacter gallaeciensis]|uniref:Uncharacterized protein n=1 Tax=Phaeobacter gallaeciensis TaxID=60890 RepID=A0A1B0ZSF3_9RHOB|nr:hypothetical protein JL2886_02104 [Phaeobacter gallaeciensis]